MTPMQARQLEQAQSHQASGNLKRAAGLYRQVLRNDPQCVTALFNLAILLIDTGEPAAAVDYFQRLLVVRPELAPVQFNLGTLLSQLGRTDEAIAAFYQAIALDPNLADAHNNLGTLLRDRGALEAALVCFQKAVELAPTLLGARVNLGTTLIKLRRYDEAIPICRAAVEQHPQSAEAHFALGLALDHAQRGDEAASSFREAVRLNPNRDEWRFHLAARGGDVTPATAPAEYVASLFDAYAAHFDQHLVGELRYRTPEHLQAALAPLATGGAAWRILDLGCGTGLCGELFKPLAAQLIGIDLSPEMVKVARERGIYDELSVADIASSLRGREADLDLVLAADVFVYVGDLTETFALVAAALKPGGLFAFSVEATDAADYILSPTRRYAHRLAYLQALARQNQLSQVRADQVVLRQDHGRDVAGWIVVLVRQASPGPR